MALGRQGQFNEWGGQYIANQLAIENGDNAEGQDRSAELRRRGNVNGHRQRLSISGGGYPQGGSAAGRMRRSTEPEGEDKDGFWPLEKCIKAYTTYLDSKRLEIQEQQNARRYRHGAQWTSEQIKTFNDRKQPVVTYNKIGRKIDGIVGLVERLKQDPKAYPRTPQHQAGADLATAVLRYLMDSNKWNEVAPVVNESGGGRRPRRHRARPQADAGPEADRAGHDAGHATARTTATRL